MNAKVLSRRISMALIAWLSKSLDVDVEATMLFELGRDEDGVLLTIDNEEYEIIVRKL